MKKKSNQIIRHILQLISLIIYPGLFIMTWNAIGDVYKILISGSLTINSIMSPLLIIIVIMSITAIWGRFFCSYVCSFGFVQEIFNKLGTFLHIKKIHIKEGHDKYLKGLKYLIIVISIILWTININTTNISPWNAFGILVSLSNYGSLISVGGLIFLIIIIVSLFVDRFFCRYFCPLGGIFNLLSKKRLYKIKKDNKCINCSKCNRVCPMNINVQNKVNSGECINCHQCIEACPVKALSTTFNQAINGTIATVSLMGLTYIGTIVTDNIEDYSTYSESQEQGKYQDGTYTGSAKGYRGNIDVKVIVKNGNISSITIESYKDDYEFFNKAKNKIINEIINTQSTNVSVISGATYSSKGIINAVINALNINTETMEVDEENNALEKKESEIQGVQEKANNTSTSFVNVQDGTYEGTGQGRNGSIRVSVVIKNHQVTSIDILSSNEDTPYFNKAIKIVDSIIEKQSLDVSKISGATMSSNGILEAVANALNITYTNTNSSIKNNRHGH